MPEQSVPQLIRSGRTSTQLLLDGRLPSRVPELERVRRGVYVAEQVWDDASPEERYGLLVRATLPELKRAAPLSHESAAVLLGIPVIGSWPAKVHVVERTAAGGRSSALVVRHGSRREVPVTMVGDIAVTSPARTAVDLALTRSFASGLAAADFVLASKIATPEELEAELAYSRHARGHRRAQLVLRFADARAESAGESLSRAQMIELDLPLPQLQQEFYDDDGYIGRTDFWWPELKIVGEFDGFVKFGRALAASDSDARRALWLEKQREDRLRRLGLGMVRWIWSEALRNDVLRRILTRAGVR